MRRFFAYVLLSVVSITVSFTRGDSNWPRWRGPEQNGHTQEKNLPVKWSDADLVWKVPLPGIGQSSPIIWGDRIFLTAALDKGKERIVFGVDRKSGKIVWHLGPVYPDTGKIPDGRVANLKLPRPVDQMSGEHFPHIIPKGLPGAGDLLVLDNQGNAGIPTANVEAIDASRVLEIDPVKKEIVWQYNGESSGFALWQFHTEFMGSVQRLPNGNTLIDEAQFGHVFQVTPQGEEVWDYVSPYFGKGKFGGSRMVMSNNLYRVQPIPYDWVPAGTPHQEKRIVAPDLGTFRVPGAP